MGENDENPVDQGGRRMSRADETRRRLVAHGRIAFAAKGHDGVSLQRDVLEPSGVSNGSFYHQFSDKTALLVAILDEANEAGRVVFQDTLVSARSEGVDRSARQVLEMWFALVDGAEDLFRIQLRERDNADPRVRELLGDLRERWVGVLAASLRDRTDATDQADLAARMIASLTHGVLTDYLATPVDERPAVRRTLLDALPRFVEGGIEALAAPTDRSAGRGGQSVKPR